MAIYNRKSEGVIIPPEPGFVERALRALQEKCGKKLGLGKIDMSSIVKKGQKSWAVIDEKIGVHSDQGLEKI